MAPLSPDYIIIGGGTSGLVVANRLSEDRSVQVLVLEAGDDLTADPRVNVPAFWTSLIGSDATWQFRTVPQPGLGGRSIRAPQGKALGGSSAVNGQAFIAPGPSRDRRLGQVGKSGVGLGRPGAVVQKSLHSCGPGGSGDARSSRYRLDQ